MPRYYFNIRNGHGFTSDEEGQELSSDTDARAHAILGARSLISADVMKGELDLGGQIEVTDDEEQGVMTIRFRDAVNVFWD